MQNPSLHWQSIEKKSGVAARSDSVVGETIGPDTVRLTP